MTNTPERSDAELVKQALSYPYAFPARSFLFKQGGALPADQALRDFEDLKAGRIPILAYGSNRSPVQLRRKFSDNAVIPVMTSWLADHEIAYAGHITRYGSVPATLVPCQDVAVEVAVMWVDAAQLLVLDETEGDGVRYQRVKMSDLTLAVYGVGVVKDVQAYIAINGALAVDGQMRAVAAFSAKKRTLPALHQDQLQAELRLFLGVGDDEAQFVLDNIRNEDTRQARSALMRAASIGAR